MTFETDSKFPRFQFAIANELVDRRSAPWTQLNCLVDGVGWFRETVITRRTGAVAAWFNGCIHMTSPSSAGMVPATVLALSRAMMMSMSGQTITHSASAANAAVLYLRDLR